MTHQSKPMINKKAIVLCWIALNGFLIILLSAMKSHYLPKILDESSLAFMQTALFIHLTSLIGLIFSFLLSLKYANIWIKFCNIFQNLGLLSFCGLLYIRIFLGSGALGAFHYLIPIGGLSLMLAWLSLVIFGLKKIRSSEF